MSDFFGDSVGKLQKRVRVIQANERKAKARVLFTVGRLILTESNAQVPHEEGDFERGGRVTVDADLGQAAISYRDTAYPGQATDLHENMELRHDSGRNAKFLERAMAACAERARALLGKGMKMETMN